MKVRAQIAMVLNLDKCIGCHTCSVICKNVWTNREGVEYAWLNNVETKPGTGYPEQWENQKRWQGGWTKNRKNQLVLRGGKKLGLLSHIFANPYMPAIDDYYEPFTYNYEHLQKASDNKAQPVARPYSQITGFRIKKIISGPNWEDDLGGEFKKRSKDPNFDGIEKHIYGEFKNTFLMYLPRLCEHCLNPSCVASCPGGAIYKRDEDGVVLIDQDKCRGWRLCVSGCPYKKIYFNWKSGKSEKCIFCYPRIENGNPTVCSETCVGRIRYLGVMLYDADRIKEAASTTNIKDIYEQHLSIFLDPNDPEVIKQAQLNNIPESTIQAAQKSPIYKLVCDWQIALPLHPEFRTLPMVWYIPPLSPIQSHAGQDLDNTSYFPQINELRIPIQYLANLFTAGDTDPVIRALKRLIALRIYKRSQIIDNEPNPDVLSEAGLTLTQIEEMYRYLALADYADRFVIPAHHPELSESAYLMQGGSGFNFDQGTERSQSFTIFPASRTDCAEIPIKFKEKGK